MVFFITLDLPQELEQELKVLKETTQLLETIKVLTLEEQVNTLDRELEDIRSEVLSLKLTNEEYRKTLKQKNSALTDLKRELESLKTVNAGRVKELEFNLASINKRSDHLAAENKTLLEKYAELQIA